MNDNTLRPICLLTGELGFDLFLNDARLADYLSVYYAAFTQQQESGYPVRINWAAAPNDAVPAEFQTRFDGEALTLSASGYKGRIETEGADLDIDSAAPFVGVDYFFRSVVAFRAFRAGGMMFHGAGILRNERGYVFFGHSGSGKSTVASFSTGDVVLNDDLLILRPVKEGWKMYATPFWNPTQVRPTNSSGMLYGMYCLVKDQTVYQERMSLAQAVGELTANTPLYPANGSQAQAVLERCLQLGRSVPAYWLHFLKDASFWNVVEGGYKK